MHSHSAEKINLDLVEQYTNYIQSSRGAELSTPQSSSLKNFAFNADTFNKLLDASPDLHKTFYNKTITIHLHTDGTVGHLSGDLPVLQKDGTLKMANCIGLDPKPGERLIDIVILGAQGGIYEQTRATDNNQLLSVTINVTEENYYEIAKNLAKHIESPPIYQVHGQSDNNCIFFMDKLLRDSGVTTGLKDTFPRAEFDKLNFNYIKHHAQRFVIGYELELKKSEMQGILESDAKDRDNQPNPALQQICDFKIKEAEKKHLQEITTAKAHQQNVDVQKFLSRSDHKPAEAGTDIVNHVHGILDTRLSQGAAATPTPSSNLLDLGSNETQAPATELTESEIITPQTLEERDAEIEIVCDKVEKITKEKLKDNAEQKEKLSKLEKKHTLPQITLSYAKALTNGIYQLHRLKIDEERFSAAKKEVEKQIDLMHKIYGINIDLEQYHSYSLPDLRIEFIHLFQSHAQNKFEQSEKIFQKILVSIQEAKSRIANRRSHKEEYAKNVDAIHREQKDLVKKIQEIKYNNTFSYLSAGCHAAASADLDPTTKSQLVIAGYLLGIVGDANKNKAEKRLQNKKGIIDGYNSVEHTYSALIHQINSEILADQMFISSQENTLDQNSTLLSPEEYQSNLNERLEYNQKELTSLKDQQAKLEAEMAKLKKEESSKISPSNYEKLFKDKGILAYHQNKSEIAANLKKQENLKKSTDDCQKAIDSINETIQKEIRLKDINVWAYNTLSQLQKEKGLSESAAIRTHAYAEGCALYQREIAAVGGLTAGIKSILEPLRPYLGSKPEKILSAGALLHQAHMTFDIMNRLSSPGLIKLLNSNNIDELIKNYNDFGKWQQLLIELVNPSLLLLGKATSLLMSMFGGNQDPLQITLQALETFAKKLSAQIQSGFQSIGMELVEIKDLLTNIEAIHLETKKILISMAEKNLSLNRLYANNMMSAVTDASKKADTHAANQLARDIDNLINEIEGITPSIEAKKNLLDAGESSLAKYLIRLNQHLKSSSKNKSHHSYQAISADSLLRMTHHSHQINHLAQQLRKYGISNYENFPDINVFFSVGKMLNLLLTKATTTASHANLKSHLELYSDIMSTYLPYIKLHGEKLLSFMTSLRSNKKWMKKLQSDINSSYQSLLEIVKKEVKPFLDNMDQIDVNKVLSESKTIIEEMKGSKYIGSNKFSWQYLFFGDNRLKHNVPTTLYWEDCKHGPLGNATFGTGLGGITAFFGVLFPPTLILTIPLNLVFNLGFYTDSIDRLLTIQKYNNLIELLQNYKLILPRTADLMIYLCPITKQLNAEARARDETINTNKSFFAKRVSPFKLVLSHHFLATVPYDTDDGLEYKDIYSDNVDFTLYINDKEIFIQHNKYKDLPDLIKKITNSCSTLTLQYMKTYDAALNNSINTYYHALNATLNPDKKTEKIQIALTDISDGILIPHHTNRNDKTKLLPTFLAASHLETIQQHPLIAPIFAEKEIGTGSIYYTYRLQPGINKNGDICLQFVLTYQFTNIHNEKYDLIDVIPGSVDLKTLQTYTKMVFADGKYTFEDNPNELLLEFMFGTVDGTGLTAQGSFDLNDNGIICPNLLPFPGLYQLLKQSNCTFHYDSTKYNAEISAELMEYAKSGGQIPDKLKDFFTDELIVIPKKDYFRFQQNMSNDKNEIYHRLLANSDYKKIRDKIYTSYDTLVTALKVNVNLDYKTIVELLGQANIPHPDLLDILAKDNVAEFLVTLNKLTTSKSDLVKVLKPFLSAKSPLFCKLEETVKNINSWHNAMQQIVSGSSTVEFPINLPLWEIPDEVFDRSIDLILSSQPTSDEIFLPNGMAIPVETSFVSNLSLFSQTKPTSSAVWSDPHASAASSACGF